jgi:iron complex outermembrane receptor protein
MKPLQFLKNSVLLFLLLSNALFAQIEVVVNAEKDFYDFVYSEKNIINFNYKTVSEAIYWTPNINLIHKGFPVTQAHLFINGGSFEQVGIFIDDLKFNDIQTGHYNFDFAFTSLDIDTVNVIKKGTTLFGSGSLNGLVNIKLKEIEKDSFQLISEYGTYNIFYSALRAEKKFEDGGISISTEKSFSDGYYKDTDYKKETVFLTGNYLKNKVYFGYDEKEYGAYNYYSPGANMPSFEYVITRFSRIISEPVEGLELSTYIRTHSDVFTLNRDNPSYYQNNHLNLLYGGLAKYNYSKNFIFQYNWQREEIQSSKLGFHHRIKNSGLVGSYITFFDNLKTNLNLAIENYDSYNSADLLPSLNINYEINNIQTSFYYSYSGRYPNFTELYYQDPFNKGDSSLKPEKSNEAGLGITVNLDKIIFNTGGFYRMGFDIIDWAKNAPSDTIWQIRNIGKINTAGLNTGISVMPFEFMKFKVDYSYLDSYFSENYISKYGLSYLKNKLSATLELSVLETDLSLQYNYKSYINRDDVANLLDIILSKKINNWLTASFKVNNALNYYFEEIKGIPAPERTMSGKIQVIF